MSWFVEHLHRDGTVLTRIAVPHNPTDDAPVSFCIGRALDNELILDDPHCASHHARLEISADGTARLIDLNTQNGIIAGRRKRATTHEITNDSPYRLGQSIIRVRSSDWPLVAEKKLSKPAWPIALLALLLVLSYGAWNVWLTDVQEQSPKYLYDLSAQAAGLCLWSAMYALFGRLIAGVDRFFSHLIIASAGYLAGSLILRFLDLLGFSTSWMWPIRITEPVVVLVIAITVRAHLRLADPRHWPTLRIAVALVATLAITIPLAQQWVSHKRLTDVQTHYSITHPAFRWAQPVDFNTFSDAATVDLKVRADKARKHDDGDDADDYSGSASTFDD
jgi:FHA domain